VVVITCQKNSILPRAITTNRCGKGRSKEEVRRQKAETGKELSAISSVIKKRDFVVTLAWCD
jgi:hypothetical protein